VQLDLYIDAGFAPMHVSFYEGPQHRAVFATGSVSGDVELVPVQ
jgi:hypothetical protein